MDGKAIKEARKRLRMSQKALGNVIGVSNSQISRFEAGTRRPRLDEATKIAECLNLDISDTASFEGIEMSIGRRGKNVKAIISLAEGAAILEYPVTLSLRSRKALRAWLESLIEAGDG